MSEIIDVDVPQSVETQEQLQPEVSTEVTTPKEETPKEHKFKVKVLHEEKELTESEALPYIQKGMDYDRVKSQYEETKAEKQFIEKLAKKYGMEPAQFKKELETAAEEAQLTEFRQKGIPDDIAKEIVDNRAFRTEIKEKESKQAEEVRMKNEVAAFLAEYPEVKAESIPPSVWQDVDKGIPLTRAYAWYESKSSREEAAKKQKIAETNQKNAESSTGGLTGNAAPQTDFISYERFETMTSQEVANNYAKIQKSMKHWKK
jgi:hypothetical protein